MSHYSFSYPERVILIDNLRSHTAAPPVLGVYLYVVFSDLFSPLFLPFLKPRDMFQEHFTPKICLTTHLPS